MVAPYQFAWVRILWFTRTIVATFTVHLIDGTGTGPSAETPCRIWVERPNSLWNVNAMNAKQSNMTRLWLTTKYQTRGAFFVGIFLVITIAITTPPPAKWTSNQTTINDLFPYHSPQYWPFIIPRPYHSPWQSHQTPAGRGAGAITFSCQVATSGSFTSVPVVTPNCMLLEIMSLPDLGVPTDSRRDFAPGLGDPQGLVASTVLSTA